MILNLNYESIIALNQENINYHIFFENLQKNLKSNGRKFLSYVDKNELFNLKM